LAWGGATEQAQERAAGNRHAKNWCDEALKVVEAAVEEYWTDAQASSTAADATATDSLATDETLESEFDRHRRLRLEKESTRSLGWQSELRNYLSVIADDVSKEMNVIDWWAVCTPRVA
jgi:hypothetical protein